MPKKIPALLAVLALPAAAMAGEGAAAGPFTEGWYATPMLTYMRPDKARCNVDPGLGGSVAFGNRSSFASIEAWGQFVSLDHGPCTYQVPNPNAGNPGEPATIPRTEPAGSVKLNGGGLGLVLGPFFEAPALSRIFGVVGFGVLKRKGEPQYGNGTTIFGDLGVGYLYPFQLFGHGAGARLETRYRYDVQQPPYPTRTDQDPPPAHTFGDVIVNLGLQIALSSPPPAPAPEPVAVVPVQEPTAPPTEPAPAAEPIVETPPPEPAGPPTVETAKAGDTIVLEGVNFETAKAKLTSNAKTILDGVAAKLAARPELKVEIGGHTDARGSDAYNQNLSERRAQAVVAYLTAHGVDGARLSARGYGKSQPIDSNETDEGREKNRRVEMKVVELTEEQH